MRDNDNSSNTLDISGQFLRNNFFGSKDDNLIDISFIGNYEIIINILGLNDNDYIYDTINNLIDLPNSTNNLSKTYNIEVNDITAHTFFF